MDCMSPILGVATRLWDCTAKRVDYIRELEENLNSLESLMEELSNLRRDVKLQAGKTLIEKINAVTELKGKGHFDVVTDRLPCAPVDERPMGKTVGLDLMFEKVRRCLEDEQVRSIGLYGIGVLENHPLAENQ
ncbi:hypothetical protein AAG906_023667 [Vitis piasezkii]